MSKNTLAEYSRKLLELSNVETPEEVYSTLISAIDEKLKSKGSNDDTDRVKDIQSKVEKHYELESGSLVNSFTVKDRRLTEPKLVWVMVCLHIFEGDRKKVKNLIGNGLGSQKVYTCYQQFKNLSENVPHEKKIKTVYNAIIKSYE